MADQTSVLKKSRRAQEAKKRIAVLAEKYVAEGMAPEDAHERAIKELRDNGRSDTRAG